MPKPTKADLQRRIELLEAEIEEVKAERTVLSDALIGLENEHELQHHLVRAYRHILGLEDLWGRVSHGGRSNDGSRAEMDDSGDG